MNFDVFNGDADGICALLQLRLSDPKESELVTGVKRDINLLERVDAGAGDEVTVLDISMHKNQQGLRRILERGAVVFYADHHQPGEIPNHPNLTAKIDQDPNTCTSLIVDQYLEGKFKSWAITAAFGDNMKASAEREARVMGLTASAVEQLELLGTCINYNGYGSSLADLHIAPAELYKRLSEYTSPFDYIGDPDSGYDGLVQGYRTDIANAKSVSPEFQSKEVAVYLLPDAPWARRVSGVFGNQLANDFPDRAHAVLSVNASGGYMVSVRAPLANKTGADTFCSSFATGGGRAAAAGINHLPQEQLVAFIQRFSEHYSS